MLLAGLLEIVQKREENRIYVESLRRDQLEAAGVPPADETSIRRGSGASGSGTGAVRLSAHAGDTGRGRRRLPRHRGRGEASRQSG